MCLVACTHYRYLLCVYMPIPHYLRVTGNRKCFLANIAGERLMMWFLIVENNNDGSKEEAPQIEFVGKISDT